MQHNQMADIALRLISKVQVQADDMTLNATTAAKNWLKAIKAGTLVVVAPPTVAPTQDPSPPEVAAP